MAAWRSRAGGERDAGALRTVGSVAALKPAYLVCGDDDARIDDWRLRLRRRAEAEGGNGALEAFDAKASGPGAIAASLNALSFGGTHRYLLVDGTEAWKAGDLPPLEEALRVPPPDTTLTLIARGKAAARLVKAVEAAGGEVRDCPALKAWQLPKWVVERAGQAGLRLDLEGAKVLVARVGPRQQRLVREVERLALVAHPGAQLSAEQVERLAAGDAPGQAYDLADAVVAGDRTAALAVAEQLRSADERPGRLLYPVVRRLRDVHRAARLLDAGVPEKAVAGALKMPPWAAKRTLAQARDADRDGLANALCVLGDLERQLREPRGLDEDTAFTLALARAAG